MQTVMQDLQLHLNYVTIYVSTYGKRNWKYILQFYFKITPRNRGWTEQSGLRLTNALPHTTLVFCQETWAITKYRVMLSDGQLELLNSDTGRELESHFQLNDSRRMWQGLKTICSSGNNPSAEVRADPLLAEELNTFYGRFDRNGGATLPIKTRQEAADRAAMLIMLLPCRRTRFGEN